MLRISIGSLALVGAVLGGIALVKVGPVFGPFHFNSGLKEYTDYDVQKAIAARIAIEKKAEQEILKVRDKRIVAEKKAEEAALKRAETEKRAELAAHSHEVARKMGVKNADGKVYDLHHYAFYCRAEGIGEKKGLEWLNALSAHCNEMQKRVECPRVGEKKWKFFHLDIDGSGVLFIC